MLRIVITSTCLICLAAAQAGPLLAPDASAGPAPTPIPRADAPQIADYEFIEPGRTPRTAHFPAKAPPSALAAQMNAALRGERRAPPRAAAQAAEPPIAREWSCGSWQELWQGRGSARTCEWR